MSSMKMVQAIPEGDSKHRLLYNGASCVVTRCEGDYKFSSVDGIKGYLNTCWTLEAAIKEFKTNVDRERT